jgi:hypothetical protein
MIKRVVILEGEASRGRWKPDTVQMMKRTLEILSRIE